MTAASFEGWARGAVGLLLAVVCAGAPACERRAANERAAPESAFRAFRDALQARDREAIWAFLGEETRAELERRAEAFGEDARRPVDLLQVYWAPEEVEIATLRRAQEDEAGVTLVVTTVHGHEASVRMLRAEPGWRVELRPPVDPE